MTTTYANIVRSTESEEVQSASEAASEATAGANGPSNGSAAAAGVVPDWLKADLFVDLLKKIVPDFKAIKSFTTKSANGAGENYATLLVVVQLEVELLTGKSEQISYMLKLPIESVQKLITGSNIFDIERAIYRDVIPELEQIYGDAGIEVKLSPQYYELQTPSEFGVILLEDLRQRGFKNVNRLEGFDIEHTKCTLKKLAQWHAASAVRVETRGNYSKAVRDGIVSEELLAMIEQMQGLTERLFTECASTYDGHEAYIDGLASTLDRISQDYRTVIYADPSEFNVLSHGDFWGNNIMFQYDDLGKIKETYFLDFQGTRYTSPAQDLYYLLISSTQYEIKLKHFDHFIKYYHDHLIECLELLKYPKKYPTLKDIHIALFKHSLYGLAAAYSHMAIALLDPTEAANMDNLLGNTQDGVDLKRKMFTNDRFRKHAEAVLPWLNNRGAFGS